MSFRSVSIPQRVVHELKTWSEDYDAVESERKPFEIRFDDCEFRVGDVLCLRRFDPDLGVYTGEVCYRLVTYLLRDERFVLKDYVVMGVSKEYWLPEDA